MNNISNIIYIIPLSCHGKKTSKAKKDYGYSIRH